MRLNDQEFDQVIQDAIEELPEQFLEHLDEVLIDVMELPEREMLHEVRASKHGLLGLYRGVPLPDRSVSQAIDMPARIILFKRNIERVCLDREEMIEQIRVTLLHEIGHHFGFDEEDLDELGYG
jgi:predicted Zn-dependent protease with MMP-like domain